MISLDWALPLDDLSACTTILVYHDCASPQGTEWMRGVSENLIFMTGWAFSEEHLLKSFLSRLDFDFFVSGFVVQGG
jgi:hypothetical protein